MNLQNLNSQNKEQVAAQLFQCCASKKWVSSIMELFPFASETALVQHATDIWYNDCDESDWRASFEHHPKIGDLKSLEEKFANTKHLAGTEQAGASTASKATLQKLAQANKDYENKNGFIFIVCATGKTADEMLRLLEDRLDNPTEEEVHIAMGEQAKITMIRLKKLLPDANWSAFGGSQLTTHVLDTSIGSPGQNITIKIQESHGQQWQTVSQGVTNADGRIADLLPPGKKLQHKSYKMIFKTAAYFQQQNVRGFYPEVEIQFTVMDDKHYHVPLLINPFGYSTYRGS